MGIGWSGLLAKFWLQEKVKSFSLALGRGFV